MASLVEALTGLPAEFEVGFVESPQGSMFVRRTAGALRDHRGSVDLDWVYDARLFTAGAEFHWWWDQSLGEGRHSVLDDAAAKARSWWALDPPAQRVLRGPVKAVADGWSKLHDGHSRPLWVPVEAVVGRHLALGVVEYVKRDEHGNVGVIAERFTTVQELS
ncbi:CRISPR-associated protein Csx19 [Micropruina sp.]|uniref:type III-D CRISPR-associated protein Csx19 n=1 Tax=Micropruina sp. TaxID=2737536 RepID=UPI0039E6A2E1